MYWFLSGIWKFQIISYSRQKWWKDTFCYLWNTGLETLSYPHHPQVPTPLGTDKFFLTWPILMVTRRLSVRHGFVHFLKKSASQRWREQREERERKWNGENADGRWLASKMVRKSTNVLLSKIIGKSFIIVGLGQKVGLGHLCTSPWEDYQCNNWITKASNI